MWTLLWLGVVGFIAVSMFWYFFKSPILEVLRWIRWGELGFVNLFDHKHDYCMVWLRLAHVTDARPTADVVGAAQGCFGQGFLGSLTPEDQLKYYTLTGTSIGAIEQFAGNYFKWPFIALFGWLGYYIIFKSPRNKFRVKHDLESFIKLQAEMWPVISPIVNFNPIHSSARNIGATVPDRLPLFAEALSPEEWVAWHRIPVTNKIADREATRRALLIQLGPRWTGLTGQPAHVRALFAAFAMKGAQQREESDDFLGQMALCWSPKGGFNPTGAVLAVVDKILRDPEQGGKALEIADQHAYRTTALLGTLRWARMMGGVLAPAQFVWLRAADRDLWYALNNLGRRSFHTEGAGALAHYMAEQNAKKPLPIPRIDTALVTLNQYLRDANVTIPRREGDAVRQTT